MSSSSQSESNAERGSGSEPLDDGGSGDSLERLARFTKKVLAVQKGEIAEKGRGSAGAKPRPKGSSPQSD